jgi:hypothetical protein
MKIHQGGRAVRRRYHVPSHSSALNTGKHKQQSTKLFRHKASLFNAYEIRTKFSFSQNKKLFHLFSFMFKSFA